MKILIDTADTSAIRKAYEYLPIKGVTTNPSILLKAKRDPKEVLQEIRGIVRNDDFHVQAVGSTSEELVEDARAIRKALGKDIYVKIAATPEGFKAMKILKADDYRITATAIYYEKQALLASQIGVDYIAPYFNRISNEGMDPCQVIGNMKKILEGTGTKILAASFKRSEQVVAASLLQVEAITVSPEVLDELSASEKIIEVAEKFNSDFHELTGSAKGLKDIL